MRVVFMGSPPFAAHTLSRVADVHEVVLVVSQPAKRKGRGKTVAEPAVVLEAHKRGLDVFQPKSARSGELAERLRASGAALAIVVAYGKILPLEVLEALPGGCLNVHASILPALRGAAPIQWAVINGLEATGVSIMQLDEGMDTGPVYATREVPIDPSDTSGSMFEKLAPVGAELLLEVLAEIEAGRATAIPQDETLASHARMLTKADGVIDWTRDAADVSCRVRGVDPWPGAQSSFGELGLKLFGAEVVAGQGAPGEVLSVAPDGIIVSCGEGAVRVRGLQPAGSKRMSAIECARGRRIAVGSRLGARLA